VGDPLIGRLLLVDSLSMRFRELKLRKNPDCPVCGTHPTVTALIDYDQFCGIQPEPAANAPLVNGVEQIDVTTYKQQRDAGKNAFLLDVREPHEFQIAQIGGYLIPLGDLQKRVSELDKSREIVVHCKMGGRSQKAAEFLQQSGFKVKNLAGGINAWSEKIDPKVPKY
jgi:sulfur-carrier protein adenylyltransferase/sulfurtransferase